MIEALSTGVPEPLVELRKLGRTLTRRAEHVLAALGFRDQRSWRAACSGRDYTLNCEERPGARVGPPTWRR